jgi:hypothetical protein
MTTPELAVTTPTTVGAQVSQQAPDLVPPPVPAFQSPGAPPPVSGAQATLSLVRPPIPRFEGANVQSTNSKITGNCAIDADDHMVLSIDDRVRMVGEYRVVGVRFEVDTKTGDTVRIQMLKPIELGLCPWNPADPTDTGVVKARP